MSGLVLVDARRRFAPCHPDTEVQSRGAVAWCGRCGASVTTWVSRPVTCEAQAGDGPQQPGTENGPPTTAGSERRPR